MPNTNINRKIVLAQRRLYDISSIEYFAALATQPTVARKAIINTLVVELKRIGAWSLIDRLWLFASETQQAATISLVNPLSTAITEVNSPAWVADQGYTSDGLTSYLDTNFNPSTQALKYTLNDAYFGVYNRTNVAENTNHGHFDATNATLMVDRSATDTATARINQTVVASTISVANTDSRGLISVRRSSSSDIAIFRNGSSLGTGTVTSNGIPNNNMYFLARNAAGTPGTFSTKQHSIAFVSSSGVPVVSFYNAIQTYMTALGTQV